jgi:hypothetical protein
MKKLLIFLMLFGGICQAQVTKELSETDEIISLNLKLKTIEGLLNQCIQEISSTKKIETYVRIGNGRYWDKSHPNVVLKFKIDSLEKRVVSLEKMVKVLYDKHIQDSLYYQRLVQPFNWTPQIDSIEAWPKDYYMIPLLNNKRKSR